MQLSPPTGLLPGERALAVLPRATSEPEPVWNRRLRFWAGRTLTADALALEQRNRGDALVLATALFAPGIVDGLEVLAERGPAPQVGLPGEASDWYLTVRPGRGLAFGGEDVALPRPLAVAVDRLPVYDPAAEPEKRVGFTARPRGTGVLVLQPVTVLVDRERRDQQGAVRDEADDAFADRVRVDACRLVWFPWPTDWAALPGRDARYRNRLAQLVFARDAARAAGEALPWEELGVPLAAAHVDGNGNLAFVDRHIVARAGAGLVAPPLVPRSGTPALWQARFRQFTDQVAELAASGRLAKDAEATFTFLPPFGLLPRAAFDLDARRTDFLPAHWSISLAPVPQDQLELLLQATAGLAPLDLRQPEQVTVYLPVPAGRWDPDLLLPAVIAPDFDQAVQAARGRIGVALGRRDALRAQARFVVGALDRADVPTFAANAEAFADEPAPLPPDPAEEDHAGAALERLAALRKTIGDQHPWLAGDLDTWLPLEAWKAEPPGGPASAWRGLDPAIADVEALIERGNDAVNVGFLRVHADIYRTRQLMLGNVEGTRLAVSPALAAIATGESAYATRQQLSGYFKQLTGAKPSPTGDDQPVLTRLSDGSGADGTAGIELQPMMMMLSAQPRFTVSGASGIGGAKELAVGGVKDVLSGGALAGFGGAKTTASAGKIVAGAGFAFDAGEAKAAISGKRPLIGKVPALRTTTIVDRIKDPPVPEAKNGAVASKLAVISALQALHPKIRLDDVEIVVSGADVAVVDEGDYTRIRETITDPTAQKALDDARTVMPSSKRALLPLRTLPQAVLRFAQILPALRQRTRRRLLLTDPHLVEELLAGFYDPDPNDGDEAAYFDGAVGAQELAIAALRAVEGRVDTYERVLALMKAARDELAKRAETWGARLAAVGHDLGEARHDVGVATALREEEQVRIDALNARRAETVAGVRFLAYARPRTVAGAHALPEAALAAPHSDPLPEALAGDRDVPDELERFLDAVRQAPLAWLPPLASLVHRLDRLEHLQQALREAKARAQARVATPPAKPVFAAAGIAAHLGRVMGAWHDATAGRIAAKATLNLAPLLALGWQDAARASLDHLALDDLIGGARGRTGVGQAAAAELTRLTHVADALYELVGTVPAEVRLRWAEQISVFDQEVDLRDLGALRGFARLDRELRLDLRQLAGWITGRFDAGNAAARALGSDLVRVCILLACHAPVSQLITAHLPKPATVGIGGRLHLALDRGAARLGMQVRLLAGQQQLATAVVEDLAPGSATVRVVTAVTATLSLAAGTRAVLLAR